MDIRVRKIYKLSEDYQEIFINNSAETNVKYNEVKLSSRTIHKDHYDDIYILEPHVFYKIEYILEKYKDDKKQVVLHFNKKLINSGLLKDEVDFVNNVLYVYNCGENNVMIQDKAVIGEWYKYG